MNKTKRPLTKGNNGKRWTEEENRALYLLGTQAADCFIGECAEAWQRIALQLGRTANACHTRYSKLKHGRIPL